MGCVASETEHSTGTQTEFPTLLCMAWGVSKSYLHCPVLWAPPCKHTHLRDIVRIRIPSAAKLTHSAVPKDLDETFSNSSFLQWTCEWADMSRHLTQNKHMAPLSHGRPACQQLPRLGECPALPHSLLPWQGIPVWQICYLHRQGLLFKDHND